MLAPIPTLRLLARLSLALESLSAAEMFGPGSDCRCSWCSQLPRECQREWGLYPGHLSTYAENIALNALLTESQYLASLRHFRQANSSDPALDICSVALLDTRGAREVREARAVLESQRKFRDYDLLYCVCCMPMYLFISIYKACDKKQQKIKRKLTPVIS